MVCVAKGEAPHAVTSNASVVTATAKRKYHALPIDRL
jgi:hypothetical protein